MSKLTALSKLALFAVVLTMSCSARSAGQILPLYPNNRASLRAEAFEAAQSATITTASAALSKVAAGFATGDDQVAQLERERERLVELLNNIEDGYRNLLGNEALAPAEQRKDLSAKADGLRAEIRRIEVKIAAINPSYDDLTRPQPLSVPQTQALLNPDEAVVLLMVASDATYIFAVSSTDIEWARAAKLDEAELDAKVAELRRGLRPPTGDRSTPTGTSFNRKLAYELYQQLLEPLDRVIKGKRVLMTVPGGSLGALPLQLLVTDPPTGRDDDLTALRSTRFLADRYAVTVLPAVSSLQALRCLLVTPETRYPGCTTPSVSGRPTARTGIDIVGFGAPLTLGKPAKFLGPPTIGTMFQGLLADTEALRKLPYLKAARIELDWLATEYAGRSKVVFGADATETALKTSQELRQARYVLLSTHGLLAGQAGTGEPGLVFTPPPAKEKTIDDDGYLSASEAARLTLSADFVVLSACNTAASDGSPGGEGLSGLARSFLFAGARALLVSHWEVDENATTELVHRVFVGFESDPKHDRAATLKAAMSAVRANPAWASPRYWGGFVLVGVPD
jgi:CHAT domain-containing protein